jgi:hypothetical protein
MAKPSNEAAGAGDTLFGWIQKTSIVSSEFIFYKQAVL